MAARHVIAYAIIGGAILILAIAVFLRRHRKPRRHERIDLISDGS